MNEDAAGTNPVEGVIQPQSIYTPEKPDSSDATVTPVTIVFKPSIPVAEIVTKLFSFKLLAFFAIALGTLYFQIINHFFPDPLSKVSEGYSYYVSSYYGRHIIKIIHYSMATVIVALPAYLILVFHWTRKYIRDVYKHESRITRWTTHFVIVTAAAIIAADLIGLLFNFLQGELVGRVLLKIISIAVIAGAVIWFYVLERLKIEYKKEVAPLALWTPIAVLSLLAVSGIILGFAAGGSPGEERARKFDSGRASDLRQLSSGIESFARDNRRLPSDLAELKNDSRYNYYARDAKDPETGDEYGYRVVSDNLVSPNGTALYELCADFSLSSAEWGGEDYPYDYGSEYDDVWSQYDKGHTCKQKEVKTARSSTITPTQQGVQAYSSGNVGASQSLASAQVKSRDAQRISDIRQIQLALELYFDTNDGSYPQTSGWDAALANGGFLPMTPKDPLRNSSYIYQGCSTDAAVKNYCLAAALEDPNNSFLISDEDANPPGCTCPTLDPVYNVSP